MAIESRKKERKKIITKSKGINCVYIYYTYLELAFTDSACFGLCLLVAVYSGLASEQQDMSRRQVLTHTTGHLVN